MASWGVAVEPVAVVEVSTDVVAVATAAERSGVRARFAGIPERPGLVGLTGERVIILRKTKSDGRRERRKVQYITWNVSVSRL